MSRRIAKELQNMNNDNDLINLNMTINVKNDNCWLITFICPSGMIYEGESYTLRITFSSNYPIDSPEVVFEVPAPVHQHIYSNGHICLNILYDDWSPALTIKSVCLSILSMLHSATEKSLPPDNAKYVSVPRRSPKETKFMFHDDEV